MSYDELIQALINLKAEEEGAIWKRAGLMTLLVERHKAEPSYIASQLGCSASLVREYIRTFKAFPGEDSRALDLSFYHHRICSRTDDPQQWLDKSLENGWSVRELNNELKGIKEKNPLEGAEKALSNVIKIIDQGGEPGAWLKQRIQDLVCSSTV